MDSRFKRAEEKIMREREIAKKEREMGKIHIRSPNRNDLQPTTPTPRAARPQSAYKRATPRPQSAFQGVGRSGDEKPMTKSVKPSSSIPPPSRPRSEIPKLTINAWGNAVDSLGASKFTRESHLVNKEEENAKQRPVTAAKQRDANRWNLSEGKKEEESKPRRGSVIFVKEDPKYICNANEKFSANEHRIIEERGKAVALRCSLYHRYGFLRRAQ